MKRWPILALLIAIALIAPGLVSADTLDNPNGLDAHQDPESNDPVESQAGEVPTLMEDIPDFELMEDERVMRPLSSYFYDPTPATEMQYLINMSGEPEVSSIDGHFLVLNGHNKPNWHGSFSMRLIAVDPDFPENKITTNDFSVNILEVNDPPMAVENRPLFHMYQGSTIDIELESLFTDVDSEEITIDVISDVEERDNIIHYQAPVDYFGFYKIVVTAADEDSKVALEIIIFTSLCQRKHESIYVDQETSIDLNKLAGEQIASYSIIKQPSALSVEKHDHSISLIKEEPTRKRQDIMVVHVTTTSGVEKNLFIDVDYYKERPFQSMLLSYLIAALLAMAIILFTARMMSRRNQHSPVKLEEYRHFRKHPQGRTGEVPGTKSAPEEVIPGTGGATDQTAMDGPTQAVEDGPTQAAENGPTQAVEDGPTQAVENGPTQAAEDGPASELDQEHSP